MWSPIVYYYEQSCSDEETGHDLSPLIAQRLSTLAENTDVDKP